MSTEIELQNFKNKKIRRTFNYYENIKNENINNENIKNENINNDNNINNENININNENINNNKNNKKKYYENLEVNINNLINEYLEETKESKNIIENMIKKIIKNFELLNKKRKNEQILYLINLLYGDIKKIGNIQNNKNELRMSLESEASDYNKNKTENKNDIKKLVEKTKYKKEMFNYLLRKLKKNQKSQIKYN
jgi:hypothetical protein